MEQSSGPRGGAILIGALLIVVGVGALVLRQTGLELGWPAWIILPGLALFFGSFALPVPAGAGLATAGGVVTVVGALLAVQDATGAYASWAYAWALVAPGGVGLGLLLYGIVCRRWEIARGGFGALATGCVLFLVGFLFFEGVLHLDGNVFGNLADVVVPAAIIAIGVVILLAAVVPGPWRRSARSGWTGWSGGSWAAPAGAPTGAGPAASGDTGARPGPGGAGSIPGPQASYAGPSGDASRTGVTLDVPLGDAIDAEVRIAFGAGRLAIAAAGPGRLVDGRCDGGVDVSTPAVGRIRLAAPASQLGWRFDRPPFDWRIGLTAEVPLRLEIETGASEATIDLADVRVTDLRLRTGASKVAIALPARAGVTRVDAEGGATQIRFTVPDGVAARIRSAVALGQVDVDTARFPRTADGRGWASPGFDDAPNRAEIEVRGGVGQVTIR